MKKLLILISLLFALSFTSCIRVTHYDGDKQKQEEKAKTKEQIQAENDQNLKAIGILCCLVFGPFIILFIVGGGLSDKNYPSGGPAG